MADEAGTLIVDRSGELASYQAPEFTLAVVEGPDHGLIAASTDGKILVGTAPSVDLRLTDRTVSRYHAELDATERGVALRDLGSTNGTLLGGAWVGEVLLRSGTDLLFGQTRARFALRGKHAEIITSGHTAFGGMIGACPAMRRVYTLLERAAPTTAPVLVTGESGTGKELAARGLHAASGRAEAPFEIVDCGGLPPTLIESELFGHVGGAFTGALQDRPGAFERADGGTLFLDELGELPLELQPKLLRALGECEIRRIGDSRTQPIDVRVVAATNRDLRREVNAGSFRSDLFFRLAVIQVELPPLRDRLDDMALLVRVLLERIATDRGLDAHIEPDAALLAALRQHHWPGNVRELRNYLEQLVILRVPPELPHDDTPPPALSLGLATSDYDDLNELPWRTAKAQLVERFERRYLARLLEQTGGNVAQAARRAGVDRGTLFRSIRRLGIKVSR